MTWPWKFDQNVAAVFPVERARSVPGRQFVLAAPIRLMRQPSSRQSVAWRGMNRFASGQISPINSDFQAV